MLFLLFIQQMPEPCLPMGKGKYTRRCPANATSDYSSYISEFHCEDSIISFKALKKNTIPKKDRKQTFSAMNTFEIHDLTHRVSLLYHKPRSAPEKKQYPAFYGNYFLYSLPSKCSFLMPQCDFVSFWVLWAHTRMFIILIHFT